MMADIPVLCFHKITDRFDFGVTTYTPEKFRQLLILIMDDGYRFCLPGTTAQVSRPVILTFDDAYESIYENALPILREFEIPFILFPVVNYIGRQNDWDFHPLKTAFMHMDIAQIRRCLDHGGVLGNHSLAHIPYARMDEEAARRDFNESQEFLNSTFDVKVEDFAPPFGFVGKNGMVNTSGIRQYDLSGRLWDGKSGLVPRIPVYRYETPAMVLSKINGNRFFRTLSGMVHQGSKATILWQRVVGKYVYDH